MYAAGMKRRCLSCDARVYPRTDPVVIVACVSSRGDHCLLGRQRSFPDKMMSCLAGFVDPGESLEEAVRREVWEESGVSVDRVRIFASQPWPIGRGTFGQLMIGCVAIAADTEQGTDETMGLPPVTVNTSELEHAEWVHRNELVRALGASSKDETTRFGVPPPFAIAHHLLQEWVKQSETPAGEE